MKSTLILEEKQNEECIEDEVTTAGVKVIQGDPRKAVYKLALPTILSLFVVAIYQITDAIWISRIGPEALSVLGFMTPFMLFIMAIAVGLAVGGGINVAKKIGAQNREEANVFAEQVFLMVFVFIVPLLVLLGLFLKPLLAFMGAGKVLEISTTMLYILLPAFFCMIFNRVAGTILVNEGNARRAMLAGLAGFLLNMVLDPICMFTLGMGVVGAAVATLISMSTTFVIYMYWFFIKKDTYVKIDLSRFRFNPAIMSKIIALGSPVTAAQVTAATGVFLLTSIITESDGTNGVATFSSGLRIVFFGMMPIEGLASSMTTLVAAARGGQDSSKIEMTFVYIFKRLMLVSFILGLVSFFFAPQITSLYTYSEKSKVITDDLIRFFRYFSVYYPAMAVWYGSVCFFVGIGKSKMDFIFNSIKFAFGILPCAYILSLVLNYKLPGVWISWIGGNWIAALIALSMVTAILQKYRKGGI